MGWEVGGRFKREGTYVYLWLIHVGAWQKPTQYCKAIILQLKIDILKKKKNHPEGTEWVLTLISNSVMSIESSPSEGEGHSRISSSLLAESRVSL